MIVRRPREGMTESTADGRKKAALHMPEVLRRRSEFLAVAKGVFRAMPLVVVQMRERGDAGPPRVGFTATRRIGKAVIRNRARRRLREIVRQLPEGRLLPGRDYVFIARAGTATARFSDLRGQLLRALDMLNSGRGHAARQRRQTLPSRGKK